MANDPLVSVILCTRDRPQELREALQVLATLKIPTGWNPELLVVDNGTMADTAAVVRHTPLANMFVRYLKESRPGKANALNAGLVATKGEIIVLTDDDLHPAEDWLERLAAPLLGNEFDAVTGRIKLAPDLIRPWLTRMHNWWLASSDDAELFEGSHELIGASVAFRRTVLRVIDGFDPELGPGAIGFAEDTLFGWQLAEAGFRISYVPEAVAVHRLHESRLRRTHWLKEAKKRGRGAAYLRYHWLHEPISFPRLRWFYYWFKLHLRRVLQRPIRPEEQGCAPWEMSYVLHMAECKQYVMEKRRPRNYTRRGLQKTAQGQEGKLSTPKADVDGALIA